LSTTGLIDAQQRDKEGETRKTKINQAKEFVWDSLSQKVYTLSVTPEWFSDNSGFAYSTKTRNGKKFYVISFEDQKKVEAFDSAKLADKLKENTQKEANPKELNLQQQKWKNAKTFDFQWKQKKFTYRIAKDKLIEKGDIEEKDKTISESPDKKYAVLIKGYNLY